MCARERAYACVLFYLFIFNSAFHFLSVFCSECLSLRLYDSKTTKASSPTLHDILLYNTPLAFRSLNKQQCLFLSIFILYLLQNKKSYFVLFFRKRGIEVVQVRRAHSLILCVFYFFGHVFVCLFCAVILLNLCYSYLMPESQSTYNTLHLIYFFGQLLSA